MGRNYGDRWSVYWISRNTQDEKKWENVRMGECQKLKSRDLSAREGKIRDKKEIILYNYTYFSK